MAFRVSAIYVERLNTRKASDTAKIKVFSLEGLRKFFVYGEFSVMKELSEKACILWCGFPITALKF